MISDSQHRSTLTATVTLTIAIGARHTTTELHSRYSRSDLHLPPRLDRLECIACVRRFLVGASLICGCHSTESRSVGSAHRTSNPLDRLLRRYGVPCMYCRVTRAILDMAECADEANVIRAAVNFPDLTEVAHANRTIVTIEVSLRGSRGLRYADASQL